MQRAEQVKKSSNTVRIIAGTLRGRRISFPDAPGLRPTGDRLRETLFSWLHDSLPGSHCLDMFAGSGVLGIECVSRGAAHAVLLEQSRSVCKVLNDNIAQLGIDNVTVACVNAMQGLAHSSNSVVSNSTGGNSSTIDIAFIDPPFEQHLQPQAMTALDASGVLADNALVAVESGKRDDFPPPPAGWQVEREKVAGDVRLLLYRVKMAHG